MEPNNILEFLKYIRVVNKNLQLFSMCTFRQISLALKNRDGYDR